MRLLKELPDDLTLIAHSVGFDGKDEMRLYRNSDGRGVLHNIKTGAILETDVDAALNRGYWEPVKKQ